MVRKMEITRRGFIRGYEVVGGWQSHPVPPSANASTNASASAPVCSDRCEASTAEAASLKPEFRGVITQSGRSGGVVEVGGMRNSENSDTL